MKKILLSALLLIGSIAMCSAFTREGLTEYKLNNGLTVMLWEALKTSNLTMIETLSTLITNIS